MIVIYYTNDSTGKKQRKTNQTFNRKAMKSIEECAVMAMDGSDKELFPFLPYILQDIWEIGADPDTIINIIRKHYKHYADINILDLGCGKGAVSVKLSATLGCSCHGIDAIPEFIAYANQKANEYKVAHLCNFETGDIRERIQHLSGYDSIILGAIGPVFGDYYATLTRLADCLNDQGIIIIDDAYIEDNSDFSHPLIYKQNTILQHIDQSGMELVDIQSFDKEQIRVADDFIYHHLKNRCDELIQKHPDKKHLFENYVKKQEFEIDVLMNKVIATTMVIRKKPG